MSRPVWNLPLSSAGIEIELDNDSRVRIRPIRPSDRAGLLAAFERFSAESRYMRFFSPRPQLGDQMAESLTDFDDTEQLAWAVFDPGRPSEVGDDSGLVIASARLFIDADNPREAEATLAVVDEYQQRGIGGFLMELLVATAADNKMDTITFEVLHQNRSMRALLTKLGATAHRIEGDASVVEYRLPVPPVDVAALPAGALYSLLRSLG